MSNSRPRIKFLVQEILRVKVAFKDFAHTHVSRKHSDVKHFYLDLWMRVQYYHVSAGCRGQTVGFGGCTWILLHCGEEETTWCHAQIQNPSRPSIRICDFERFRKFMKQSAVLLHHAKEVLGTIAWFLRRLRISGSGVGRGALLGEICITFWAVPTLQVLSAIYEC